MKIEQIHLERNGHVEVFLSTDDIPEENDWKIMHIVFDNGMVVRW